MKKVLLGLTLGTLCVVGISSDYGKSEKNEVNEPKKQTICPVMEGEINKKYYVDTEEGRIYVCCPKCIAEIKQNPKKYIEKLKKDGVQLEKVSDKNDNKDTEKNQAE